MSVHRTLAGSWAKCRTPERCELPFHLPELSVTEAEALPLTALLPLFEVAQPPTVVYPDGIRGWEEANGDLHRDYDLPAVIHADGSMEWRQHDRLHRDGDKPALVNAFSGSLEWYQHGKQHRGHDRPAVTNPNGYAAWYEDSKLHREHGPAVIRPDGTRKWHQADKLHREDGPAIIWADGRREWWLAGRPVEPFTA